MKRLVLILLLLGRMVAPAWGADTTVDDLFKQGRAAVTAGKFDDANHLFEQVITGHPEASNRWSEAQLNITQALAKKGDLAEAAKAAHICLDSAPNLQAYDNAVMLTANILSALDKNVDRANQFLTFAQAGPSGGAANPMDAVGYPSLPERESAFATMRQQAGDDASASRLRAMTYLFTGKPKDALAQYADAFRRSASTPDLTRSGSDLVLVGVRAVQGHRMGLDQDISFLVFGASGPDGKPGTPDDVTDPFAKLLPAPPPVGEGGLAQLSPEDLATLRQVRDAAQLYAGDPLLVSETRRAALTALMRATCALDGWGAPGQKDWYLQLALRPHSDEQILLTGAELAAKGRELNFGPVQALWIEVDAAVAARNLAPSKGRDEVRKQFGILCDSFNKIPFPKTAPKPLKAPAKF